jgi:hypothetical protein
MKPNLLAIAAVALVLCGCGTYVYRVAQPPSVPTQIKDQPIVLPYDPLEYGMVRQKDRLDLRITNPTEDRIILDGARSFVVDPQGESHALRPHIIGPHSFTRMLLPPYPFTYAYPSYYWGWGWGGWGPPYDPFWGPVYGPGFYGPPPVSYMQVYTRYDWTWKKGSARLHFVYLRGTNTFEQELEIVRELEK